MPHKIIKYRERLGDVLRCLPACKYLADQGHEVFFDCFPSYNGVFEMVSYVRPAVELRIDSEIIDLEVWPNRYFEYKKSKKPWHDFVYSDPKIKGADKTDIILDKLGSEPPAGLPNDYHLIAPFGISQEYKYNFLTIIQDAIKELGKEKTIILCPPEVRIEGLLTYTANSIEQMAKAVRDADQFWAINSAPIILASAVRRGKESKFWGQKEPHEQDNVFWFDGLKRMD